MIKFRPVSGFFLIAALWAFVGVGGLSTVLAQVPPALEFVPVPGTDAQPGGPAYGFRISKYEVRNDQFAAFLNDALVDAQSMAPGPRSDYMLFDAATGNIYIHAQQVGELVSGGSGSLLFSLVGNAHITFNATTHVYELEAGFESHPVTGVSWYGALKYCNWLTLDAGLPISHRCYTEAPSTNLSGWHPATISDVLWAARDLNNAERQLLVTTYLGFRLPMDDGASMASAYNEWYKAAAWDDFSFVNYDYGFGRDTVNGGDANYNASGDPFEPGTTPVGFYDGTTYNPGGGGLVGNGAEFVTVADTNAYGLYDFSGNAWEWMQGSAANPILRRYRGGGHNVTDFFVSNFTVTNDIPAAARGWVGLRIVHADPGIDPLVAPDESGKLTGPIGGPFAPEPDPLAYTLTSRSHDPIDWQVTSNVNWLDINGALTASGTLAPFASIEILLTTNDDALTKLVGDFAAIVSFDVDLQSFATRDVVLSVSEELDVAPVTGLMASGPTGGPFFPGEQIYTVTNGSTELLSLCVTSTQPWVLIDGAATVCSSVAPSLSSNFTVSIKAEDAILFAPGVIQSAVVSFTEQVSGATATRVVAVSVGLAPLTIDMASVPAIDIEPGGPTHDYRVGVFEVSNAEFVAFLNDALFNTGNARGAYMAHDTALGDVYINTGPIGQIATTGSGILMFDASDGGRITFESVQYRVVPGRENEPVSGVSWYGALKFCNWLTLRQGMPATERAYSEGPNAGEWHPATISTLDWWGTIDTANNPSPVTGSRDLNNAERSSLVDFAGYRLPMDDGQSSSSLYNEWYKAASWVNDVGFGSTDRATQDGVSSCDGGAAMADVWWKYTPTSDGNVTLNVQTESGVIPVLSVHDACPGSTCDEITCSIATNLVARVMADTEYWVRVAVDANQSTKFSMTISGPPCVANNSDAHDNCGSAPSICPDLGGAHLLYGFGRDVVSGADANFLFSDDPFLDVTPVGWFNGSNKIDGGLIPTNDSSNAYGLYDVCGNVSEWMQDVGSLPGERATRGGNWQNNIVSLLLTNTERGIDVASATRSFTGLRVVQSEFDSSLAITSACGSVSANDCLSSAPIGGVFAPSSFDYSLSNNSSSSATEYRVCIDAGWLSINETESCIEGLVEPVPAGMPGVTADFTLAFNDLADVLPAPATPAFPMTVIPATDDQPNGPRYSYRIATLETTNESFAKFLNSALLSLSNERGQYMYFNSVTGDVYINDNVLGEVGNGVNARTTLLFSPAANAHVSYELDMNAYVVDMGFEAHPVTGVSWFGAVKYCNWLTITDGLGAVNRAYTEGVNSGDWHPVTISTCAWWGTADTAGQPLPLFGARDLNARERENLINNTAGYRLPMDEFAPSASAYNEWYKAAAWDESLGINHDYGFGRDVAAGLNSADANFLTSGDPFEPESTPVGFYDGTTYDPGGGGTVGDGVEFATTAETNAYALFDMSGNVAEWMQDRGGAVFDPQLHTFRGGSFEDDAASGAHLTTAQSAALPGSTLPNVGFRIVQSRLDQVARLTITDVTAEVSVQQGVRLILREPLSVSPLVGFSSQGNFGGPFTISDMLYTLTSESATDMDWEAVVSTTGTRWLDVNGAISDSGTLSNQVPELVNVTINRSADTLSPGTYTATVTFTNMTTGYSETRDFELIIDETLDVVCAPTPMDDCVNEVFSVSTVWSSTAVVQSRTFTVSNLSASPLDYNVSTLPAWLELDDPLLMTGTLAAAGDVDGDDQIDILINTNDALENEPIGFVEDLAITFNNVTAASAIDLPLEINVRDPLDIAPLAVDTDPNYTWTKQSAGNYMLSAGNGTYMVAVAFPAEISIDYNVTADVNWLDLNGAASVADTILSGFSQSIALSINSLADNLGGGVHTATLSFNDITATNVQTRTISLVVPGDLALTPLEDYDIFAPVGGPFTPTVKIFSLVNGSTSGNVPWSASSMPPVPWLRINGAAMASSTSLPAGESIALILSIESVSAAALPIGTHTTTLTITGGVGSTDITRTVTLNISSPSFTTSPMLVANTTAQPNGPTYPFLMNAYETTNEEYISFLNDALANPTNERGQYMFVDQINGDVYINSSINGAVGNGPGLLTTKMFSPSIANHISYDQATNLYSIAPGVMDYTTQPVSGVSWYGAVKYCNWLTLDQGFPPTHRCYAEDKASNLFGWRPAVISGTFWAFRDLIDVERADYVTNYLGYRLPMDHGSNNTVASDDMADTYNEWYAAAAWDVIAGVNRLFGFGRDVIMSADANFSVSGDPFEAEVPATSPVGFYNGTSLLGNGSITVTTSNAFGLFDMTGNVYEWVQGRYNSTLTHAARGGSWANVYPSSGMNLTARLPLPPGTLNHSVGFRVLRSVNSLYGDQDLDGDVDLVDFTQLQNSLIGPYTAANKQTVAFDFDFDGDIDLQDFAVFQRMFLP